MSEYSISFTPAVSQNYPRTVQELVDYLAVNGEVDGRAGVDPIFTGPSSSRPFDQDSDKIWIHTPDPQEVPVPPLPPTPPPATSSSYKLLLPTSSSPSSYGQATAFTRHASATGAIDGTFNAPPGAYGYIIYAGNDKFYAVKDAQVIRLDFSGAIDNSFAPFNIPPFQYYSGEITPPEKMAPTIKLCLRPDRKLIIYQTRNPYALMVILNEDGTVYKQFNTQGSTIILMATGIQNYVSYIARLCDISVQKDNKILVNGDFNLHAIPDPENPGQDISDTFINNPMGICRLNSDGTFDSTFVADPSIPDDAGLPRGQIISNPFGPNGASYNKILVLGSGNILVFRTKIPSSPLLAPIPSGNIVRLLSDGTKDTSFSCPLKFTYVNYLVEAPDNKIYVTGRLITSTGEGAGSLLYRLNKDGSIDTTFNLPWGNLNEQYYYDMINPTISGDVFISVCLVSESNNPWHLRNIYKFSNTGEQDETFLIETNVDYGVTSLGSTKNSNMVSQEAPTIVSENYSVGTIGQSFSYAIVVNPSPASSYGVDSLPPGLTLNTSTGVISGTPTQAGITTIVVSATNAFGTATKGVNIQIFSAFQTINFNTPALRLYKDADWNEFSALKRGDIIVVPNEQAVVFPWGVPGFSYDLSPWGEGIFTVPTITNNLSPGFKYKYYIGATMGTPLPPSINP